MKNIPKPTRLVKPEMTVPLTRRPVRRAPKDPAHKKMKASSSDTPGAGMREGFQPRGKGNDNNRSATVMTTNGHTARHTMLICLPDVPHVGLESTERWIFDLPVFLDQVTRDEIEFPRARAPLARAHEPNEEDRRVCRSCWHLVRLMSPNVKPLHLEPPISTGDRQASARPMQCINASGE